MQNNANYTNHNSNIDNNSLNLNKINSQNTNAVNHIPNSTNQSAKNINMNNDFVITGNSDNNEDNKESNKVFKFLVPTLIVASLAVVALICSLFFMPTESQKKESSKLVTNESPDKKSYDDISLDGSSTDYIEEQLTNEDNKEQVQEDETDEDNSNNSQDNDNTEDTHNEDNTFDHTNGNTITVTESNNNYTFDNTYSNSSPANVVINTNNSSSIDISNDVRNSKTNIPLFYQSDSRWGNEFYAGSIMSQVGSGPTCMSMVYVFLTKDYSYNPLKMAEFSTNNNYVITSQGASKDFMTNGAKALGLKVDSIGTQRNKIIKEIMKGKPVIACMKPGTFSYTNSYIVIRNYNLDKFFIHDPSSAERSNKKWSQKDLENKIENAWCYSR